MSTKYYLAYNDASRQEKQLGRTITLFDDKLVKIIEKKDGTFTIEPILSLTGYDKSLHGYNTTLLSKHGFLALELTDEEVKKVDADTIMKFNKTNGKAFNVYSFVDEEKELYQVLPFSMRHLIKEQDLPVVKMETSLIDKKAYHATPIASKSESEFQEDNFLLGNGVYVDVSKTEVDDELKEHIAVFAKNDQGNLELESFDGYLLPYKNAQELNREEKKHYLDLIKVSVPICIKTREDGGLDVVEYNNANKAAIKNNGYELYYLCDMRLALSYLTSEEACESIQNSLLHIQKNRKEYKMGKALGGKAI